MNFISNQKLIKRLLSLPGIYLIIASAYAQSPNDPGKASQDPRFNQPVKTIELRNYLMRPGKRDEFIHYFEDNFIVSQYQLGGYVLGQYRVKGDDDHFFWIRGFKDMQARNKFLNDFYFSPYWKAHKTVPNSLLLNNDNVYLLMPLNPEPDPGNTEYSFNTNWFGQTKGIAVVDFYISNTKLDQLIAFVRKEYLPVLSASGIEHSSFWISETSPNEFTALPVFQDKNLLVQITFYKDEQAYRALMKKVNARMSKTQQTAMADLVTTRNTLIIYPTVQSFSVH